MACFFQLKSVMNVEKYRSDDDDQPYVHSPLEQQEKTTAAATSHRDDTVLVTEKIEMIENC